MTRPKDVVEHTEECEALHPKTISARIVPINALPDKLAAAFGSNGSAKLRSDDTNFEMAVGITDTTLSAKAIQMQVRGKPLCRV